MEPSGLSIRSLLSRFADYLGAHHARDRAGQERDRALQRGIVGLIVASVWVLQYLSGREVRAQLWFVVFLGLVLPVLAFSYRRFLLVASARRSRHPVCLPRSGSRRDHRRACPGPAHVRIPESVHARGDRPQRHPLRTANDVLHLGDDLGALHAPLDEPVLETELELALSYLIMLALVPVFFSSLIRRIHSVRAIEEERAPRSATNELAIARSAFLAKVSHELRSPLQGIVSALDVIEMRHARAFEGDEELIGRMRRSLDAPQHPAPRPADAGQGRGGPPADPRRAVRSLLAGRGDGRGRSRARRLEGPAARGRAAARAALRRRRRCAHRPGVDEPGRQFGPLHGFGRGPRLDGPAGRAAGAPAFRGRRHRARDSARTSCRRCSSPTGSSPRRRDAAKARASAWPSSARSSITSAERWA